MRSIKYIGLGDSGPLGQTGTVITYEQLNHEVPRFDRRELIVQYDESGWDLLSSYEWEVIN